MFWVVAAGVVVVLLALAWWSSGRARPGPDRQARVDAGSAEAKSRSNITSSHNPKLPGGL